MGCTTARGMRSGQIPFLVTRRVRPAPAADDQLRQFSEMLPTGFWMTGTSGGCIHVNRTGLEIIGRRLDQVVGRDWHDDVHPDDRDRRLESCRHAWDVREPFTAEYRLRRRDGSYRWCVENGAPRYDSRGAFAGYIGSITDMPDRTAKTAVRHLDHRMIDAKDRERHCDEVSRHGIKVQFRVAQAARPATGT
jgi:PAS domain S-box-containing protein